MRSGPAGARREPGARGLGTRAAGTTTTTTIVAASAATTSTTTTTTATTTTTSDYDVRQIVSVFQDRRQFQTGRTSADIAH